MSSTSVEQEISLRNYEILNNVIPTFYKKKFPYTIIQKRNEPGLELTHKNVDLVYIKDKNYFVTPENKSKYKRGGIYGGKSQKITVYIL